MDDQQTIRLECLSLAIKGGSPAHEWRRTAEVLAAWVIGEPIHHPATIHLHDSALDTLADAMRRHTTAEEIDPNPYITVTRPDGYLINKDLGGWYFLAPGEERRPFGRAVWATEDEAVADSIRHALCPAWAPEDPQMGELAHPPGKTPALDALLQDEPKGLKIGCDPIPMGGFVDGDEIRAIVSSVQWELGERFVFHQSNEGDRMSIWSLDDDPIRRRCFSVTHEQLRKFSLILPTDWTRTANAALREGVLSINDVRKVDLVAVAAKELLAMLKSATNGTWYLDGTVAEGNAAINKLAVAVADQQS